MIDVYGKGGVVSGRMRRRATWIAVIATIATAAGAVVGWHRGLAPATAAAHPTATHSAVPDEAAARAAARRSGQRVEVASRTTAADVVYANPNGTFTRETSNVPVRARRNGAWVPIDTTLMVYGNGTVGPRVAAVPMAFSGGGDGALATVARAGRVFSVSWPGRLPTPVLHGSTATYPNVLPDVDLVVTASPTGYSNVLRVNTPAAMANPALARISYGYRATRLALRVAADGHLVAADQGSGAAVFLAPAPVMWDANDRSARLGVRVDGHTLRLTPDRALLADPGLAYPVMIDPYLDAGNLTSDWAMVDSGYPNQTYYRWSDHGGSSEGQRVGLCPSDYSTTCNNSLIKRLYYTLPTPYQDDSIAILSASLSFGIAFNENNWKTTNTDLYRTSGWLSSSTSWATRPGDGQLQQSLPINNATQSTQDCSVTTNVNITFNATGAVQDAASANWATTPFMLRANDETDRRANHRFCHSAILAVTYNRAPYAPANVTVSPGGLCATGSVPYADHLPVLSASLSDPDTGDAEPLTAEFTVNWTDAASVARQKVWTSAPWPNGTNVTFNLADPVVGITGVPDNTPVTWSVRASDGVTFGPRSPDCAFQLDTHAPNYGPHLESPQYLPGAVGQTDSDCRSDGSARDGVGNVGAFTIRAATGDLDIAHYYYGIGVNPSAANALTPAAASGPVTFTWTPDREGDVAITAQAVDGSGHTGPITVCHVTVGPGRMPVGVWSLAEATGSTSAADAGPGGHSAAAGPAAAFGQPGLLPGGATAVHLDGTAGSYLATPALGVLDSSKAYAVTAWVRLDNLNASQTVLSQDGTGEPGFVLGFDKPSGAWTFWTSSTDGISMASWRVNGAAAAAGVWTHLLGVYDPASRQISLQVNVGPAAVAPARSGWAAHGALQFGRRYAKTGYTESLQGSIAQVQAFDRIVPPVEGVQLAAERVAYWRLNDQASASTPEEGGPRTLTLRNGAAIYHLDPPDPDAPPPDVVPRQPLVGDGDLVLGGGVDDAYTATPVLGLSGSFSVAVRAQVAAVCTSGHDQVVLSQPATATSRFMIKCGQYTRQGSAAPVTTWQAVLANPAGTSQVMVVDDTHLPDAGRTDGQLLVVTYNEFTQELRLYVDGQLASSAIQPATAGGTTDGGLRLGSGLPDAAGATVDNFAGIVDDVRVYIGVLDLTTIQMLNSSTEHLEL
jgi:Concanavalin A-like lectin/glucanases superfamily